MSIELETIRLNWAKMQLLFEKYKVDEVKIFGKQLGSKATDIFGIDLTLLVTFQDKKKGHYFPLKQLRKELESLLA